MLEKWILSITRTADEWGNDVPWWYNERAMVSVLAGAVWCSGGTCFEEFSGDKRTKDTTRRHLDVLYSGRVDVYFTQRGYEFIAETKNTWSGYTRNEGKACDRIEKRLDEACADIRQTKPFGMKRLGIVFAMPYFRVSSRLKIGKRIVEWLKEIEEIDSSACAWVFPASGRYMRGDDTFYYPGVAMLIKEVKR